MQNSNSGEKIPFTTVSKHDEILPRIVDPSPSWKIWQKRRYMLAVMFCLGLCNNYILRVNLSIAIVVMTENRTVIDSHGNITYEKEFSWNSKEQGFLLSSFFYGYISTLFLGGWLATKYGGKYVFAVGIGLTALLTVLTPTAADCNFYLLLSVRILEGAFEGVTLPCASALWSRWAPPLERSKLMSITLSGVYMGPVVGMPLCAYLSEALGWRSIFYFSGGLSLLWLFFWCIFVADSPDQDQFITSAELRYIKAALENQVINKDVKHPWISIVTSPAVFACTAACFADKWGHYTMLTQLPLFMKDVLHYDVNKTGVMAAMPYLAMFIFIQATGYLADFLRSRELLTTTRVRKIYCCGAFSAQAVLLTTAVYLLSPTGTIICLTLGIGLGGLGTAAHGVNCLDIAPRHASVVHGIVNTISILAGVISPVLTGYIVTTASPEEWRIVFIITSAICITGAIIYGLFASGEEQSWAKKSKTKALLSNESPAEVEKLETVVKG